MSQQVLFIHIPKCAGSSFRTYLNQLASKSDLPINKRYIPGENGLAHDLNLEQLSVAQSQQFYNSSYSLIAMHALYGLHQGFTKSFSPIYLTFLRNPFDRFVSHYNHFQFRLGKDNCKGIPLNHLDKNKALSVIKKLSNLMCRYIAGYGWEKLGAEDLYKQATDNLFLRFCAFGILEDMKSSLMGIHSVLPAWLDDTSIIDFPTNNKGDYLNENYPEWLHNLFNTHNESDIKLYNAAIENMSYQQSIF